MGSYNCPLSCFCQLYLFSVFGSDYRFLLIELPTILFAVLHEMKQTGKYQGDYLVQKPTLPRPYLLKRYCALFMYLQVDCMYVSACAVPAEFQKKPCSCTTTCEYVWRNKLFVTFRDCPDIMCSCELTDSRITVPSCSLDI